jgi:outer membrane beta-barrel protein
MEIRFRHIFLTIALLWSCLCPVPALSADEPAGQDADSVLIQPQVERREFDEADIEGDDFEVILSLGYLSIEDFGVNALLAVKLNYYVNEDIFVQLALGESKAGETSYETVTGGAPLLTDEERKLSFYRINIGYNLLPGEAFLSDNTTYNTAFYLSAGIGSTDFAGDDRYTLNYGAGFRFLFTDYLTLNTDFRNNLFDMDTFGENKGTNNLEFTLGFGFVF